MVLGAELTWKQTPQDAEWAPFEGITARNPTGGSPEEETAAEFSAFESSFDPSSEDADEFGDFEAAEATLASPSIVLPSMDQFEDFDLGEESRSAATSGSGFGGAVDLSASSSGVIAPAATDDDVDGSDRFGRLSLADSSSSSPSAPTSPQTSRSTAAAAAPSPALAALAAAESASSGSSGTVAKEGTEEEEEEEDLGPALHPGAHLTEDGQVEAEVEGRTIRVPADDIIMTSRRNSLEGGNRHHTRSRSNSISFPNHEKAL